MRRVSLFTAYFSRCAAESSLKWRTRQQRPPAGASRKKDMPVSITASCRRIWPSINSSSLSPLSIHLLPLPKIFTLSSPSSAMQYRVILGLVLVVAATVAAAPQPSKNGPSDAEIKELTGTTVAMPFVNPDVSDANNIGWVYPHSPKLVVPKSTSGKCQFDVYMDVSRCAGLNDAQRPVAYPYDQHSMDMLHNNIKLETKASNGQLYAQYRVSLTQCGFNGRFFMMPQYNDNIFDTAVMSIRLVLEEGKATSWVTKENDEETSVPQNRVAPLIKRFFQDSPEADKQRIVGDENKRGMQLSTKVTTKTTDNYMYLQFC